MRCVLRRGHKSTGLSNSLDGNEDWKIGREAASMWMALGMDAERRRAKQEVDELLASGDITSFGDWQKVVRHPPTTGASALEGHEFEGELEEGEKPYLTPDDEALVAADEADFSEVRGAPSGGCDRGCRSFEAGHFCSHPPRATQSFASPACALPAAGCSRAC